MIRAGLLVADARWRFTLGALPLPTWGEGWGEGVTDDRWSGNPLTPALSPKRVEDARKRAYAGERESHRPCCTMVPQ
jgi:hypothetical protein